MSLRKLMITVVLSLISSQGFATTVQQFEGNPQHLAYLNQSISPFSVNLHQRLIVMPRYHQGYFYTEGGQGSVFNGKPIQEGLIAKISTTGKVIWKTPLPNIAMTEPVVTNNRVIVGLGGNRMFFHNVGYGCYSPFLHAWIGLSTKTGKVVWTYKTPCQDMPTPFLAGNLVIGPTGGGNIIALNAETGKLVWQLPDNGWSAMSSPSVKGSIFYVGINSIAQNKTGIYAINWQQPKIKWFTSFPKALNISEPSPAIGNGLVFTAYMERAQADAHKIPNSSIFPDWDFKVAALNAKTGKIVWEKYLYTEYAKKPSGFWKNVDLFGSILYKGILGWLDQAFPRDGVNQYIVGNAPAKKHPGIHNPPLTYWKGLVFVEPRTSDRLYALNAKTGDIVWSQPTEPNISNPNIKNGILYIVSMKGTLYEYKAKTGELILKKKVLHSGAGPTEVLLNKTGFIVGDMTGEFESIPYPTQIKNPAF